MCRLLLANREGINEIDKRYGLVDYLKHLEKACGGHGNGIALLNINEKKIKIKKGVNFSVEEAAKMLRKRKYDWCIFHTRLASAGGITNANCHPFAKEDAVIAMNGTEYEFSLLSRKLNKTDTELILELATLYKKPVTKFIKDLSSVFIGFYQFKPFAFTPSKYKDLKILYVPDKKAIAFASQFPEQDSKNEDIYIPKKYPFFWESGKRLNIKKYEPKISEYSYLYPYYSPISAFSEKNQKLEELLKNDKDKKHINDYDCESCKVWIEEDNNYNKYSDKLYEIDYELEKFLGIDTKENKYDAGGELYDFEGEKYIFPKEDM